MELKSEPAFELINVTDIDVAYPGDLQTFTLRSNVESFTDDGNTITLTLAVGGVVRLFYGAHAHWTAIRNRTIRVPVPAAQPVQSASAPPPLSAG